ncbi:MAG: dihydrofolate reductase [Bacteroidales bacterium]|nr:dihydrofolate reductase [Candidatus Cryptobacteroides fimicaballi]
MKRIIYSVMTIAMSVGLSACGNEKTTAADDFRYSIDEFADIEVLRYQVPDWDKLDFNRKAYIYHLSEAAKAGRDITWDQYCKYNLPVRHTLEAILENYRGERSGEQWDAFMVYAKRIFFANGLHHHYSDDKILPTCGRDYFASLMEAVSCADEQLLEIIYNPDIAPTKRYQGDGKDIVKASAVNFYEGVSAAEVNAFYDAMADESDPCPISYGLNSRVVKSNGKIVEQVYCEGGLYGPAISRIISELEAASAFAENDAQKKYIAELIEYYRTGDLRTWDKFNVSWVQENEGDVDFVNGFIEDYDDPLGRKATWEGIVNYRDNVASERTIAISDNAQWFEDHSPVDPRFRKPEVKGVTAKVINVAVIMGGNYPATAIGINLPNADWIRKEYGSKSVTIANIVNAYNVSAAQSPRSILSEFAWDEKEIETCRKYGPLTDDLHTDLHECLGHGSGQLLEGTPSNALKEYTSCLEEARADLFALYYLADPKLVELGLLPDSNAYKAEYMSFIRNGLFTQFCRIELGKQNTEAHMQDRQLIAQWCYEHGQQAKVIEKKERDGKTYFVINDFEALRGLFGSLLAEIQRIKSEGDYEAGKKLVEDYAIRIGYDLHKEVLERYAGLDLKPYKGFVNPDIVPVEKDGKVVDYEIRYCDDFIQQQLVYGRDYKTL